MYSRAHLLGLPREIRDSIYKEYLHYDAGYHYNFLSGKLRDATGQPIDLALMFACTQIATEMRGLALQSNTIIFSTWYSEETRLKAAKLEHVTQLLEHFKDTFMRTGRNCITPEIEASLDQKFPYFASVIRPLERYRNKMVHFKWGQAPSLSRQFVTSTLSLLWLKTDFRDMLALEHGDKTTLHQNREFWEAAVTPSHEKVVPLDLVPWKIPTDQELTSLEDMLSLFNNRHHRHTKYRLSAAALGIQFLESIPTKTRLQIRNINLIEDRVAVGFAECHAQGFIPFCQENSRLKVERRVDLWRNVFIKGHPGHPWGVGRTVKSISSWAVTCAVSSWITEALALPSKGMPPGSFCFVLDGDPAPGEATRIMQIMLRDAAWQAALEEFFRRGIYPQPSWQQWRENNCYIFEGFPEALADICTGKSVVRCNFEMGEPSDVEQLIQAHSNWPFEKWSRRWGWQKPSNFHFPPPLPSYSEVVDEYRYEGPDSGF